MRDILLIDDDHINHFITETLIKRINPKHEISKASNGREALDFLRKSNETKRRLPDVIFLDLTMPEMDGFQFLQNFLHLTIPGVEHVRLAVLSSSNNPQDMARVKLLGAHYYLTKLATIDQLKGIRE